MYEIAEKERGVFRKKNQKCHTVTNCHTRARKLQMKLSAVPRRLPCFLFIKADSRRKRQQTVVDSLNSAAHFSRPTTQQLISAEVLSSLAKSFHRRSLFFTNPNQFSANPNHFTVSQTPSPSGRTDKRCMISRSQMRESITRPTCLLYPGRMQPCVSSAVLPAWIRIPLNSGTFSSNGSQRLNLGEKDTATA